MRAALNAVCGLTIAASTWLGIMFVMLHRPGYERGAGLSGLFVLQSLVVLAVSNAWLTSAWWRGLALVGAAALAWAGISAILANINGPHFEGYAIVIGFFLVLQSLLTILQLITLLLGPSSKVHQLGN